MFGLDGKLLAIVDKTGFCDSVCWKGNADVGTIDGDVFVFEDVNIIGGDCCETSAEWGSSGEIGGKLDCAASSKPADPSGTEEDVDVEGVNLGFTRRFAVTFAPAPPRALKRFITDICI